MQYYKEILNSDFINRNIPIQKINDPAIIDKKVTLFVKREDMNHPQLSGNKWHKLKYNLIEAKTEGFDTLLTFGGAYSNHIYAVAAAGKLFGLKTIGFIRGEEHLPLNHTLSFAVNQGMKIHYADRKSYRNKTEVEFIASLKKQIGEFYLVPEGGTNNLAVKGVSEVISGIGKEFDYICCACGTGGTLAGIITGLKGKNLALGFSVLKGGDFLNDSVKKLINSAGQKYSNWSIILDYHFGGYAKINNELIEFIKRFEVVNNIPIEPVYTGKLFFGIYDLIQKDYFKKDTKLLAIHTGGLQGLEGMKERIAKLNSNNKNVD